MTTKIRTWGNSYGLGVPKAALKELNLKPGAELTFKIENGGYVFKPVLKKSRIPSLEELIANIPKEGIKNEWAGVYDVGREIVEWNENILPKKRRHRLG